MNSLRQVFLFSILVIVLSVLITSFVAFLNGDFENFISTEKSTEVINVDILEDLDIEKKCFLGIKQLAAEKFNTEIPVEFFEMKNESYNLPSYVSIGVNYTIEEPYGFWLVYEFGDYSTIGEIGTIKHYPELLKENIVIMAYSHDFGFEGCGFTKLYSSDQDPIYNLLTKERISENLGFFEYGGSKFGHAMSASKRGGDVIRNSITLIPVGSVAWENTENYFENYSDEFLLRKIYSKYIISFVLISVGLIGLITFYYSRKKKQKRLFLYYFILISLIILSLVVYTFNFYSNMNLHEEYHLNYNSTNWFPISRKNPELNNIVGLSEIKEDWNRYCDIPEKDAMINIVHIIKEDDTYHISCETGGSYYTQDILYQTADDLPVFWGVVKRCDLDPARLIDSSFRAKENCIFYLNGPIPENLTDYYAFSLRCRNEPLGKKTGTDCESRVLNTEFLYPGIIGVLDPVTNSIYM